VKIDRRISIDVSDEIKRLVPILGKDKAARLETAYLLADEDSRKRILEMIDTLKAAVFSDKDLKNTVLIEPPAQEFVSNGDLQIGTVLYGKKKLYPLMIDRDTLLTHVGIFGSSGYGKTNLVYWLIMNLAQQNIPVLIFDFSKRNYRDLLSIPELKDKIRIYTLGRNIAPFRFNPLKPPEGVQISQWAKEFSEVFDHAYWMLGGGRHIILKALGAIYEAKSPESPRIRDLKDWLEKYRNSQGSSREKNWISTAERPLESLCFRELGDVFDCEEGVMPSEFIKEGMITILELDPLSTNDKTFLIEIMLQWIRDACLVSGIREKLTGVIILEEAHHVLNREKSKRVGMETVMDLIFREIRELGIGVIYADQHPSLVSYPALGNTSTHIYMNLGLDTKYCSDILDATNMLGLKYEDEGDYLRRLPVGHAFILMRRLAFPYPFLVSFPLVEIKKGCVTDEMVNKYMESKLLEVIRSQRELMPKEINVENTPEPEISHSIEEPDDKSWKIIEILGNFHGSSTSEIYNLIGISGNSFKKRAENLCSMGLIASVIGKVYRQRAIYYFLTAEGEKIFESKFQRQIENIGISTEDVMNFLISHFGLKGCRISEKNVEQITFEKEGSKICVNIENDLNKEKVDDQINRLFKDGNLHFVCLSEKIKNFVIQRAAKYCFDHKLGDVTVFVAGLNELREGNDFKRIEFQI
jgi:DNA helicase HerA-like ATPase/DNA-binding MarR family transcriptional regulator